ncbi:MAG: low molecular weight phosphotyrosine protein phosphatase, partial [Porticoccaceae bacterium]
MNKISVLFVCLGNICRSPTAHGVFQSMVDRRGLGQQIEVDSAGTGDWHLGHAPDKRTSAQAAQRGYDLSNLRAR